MSAVLPMLEAAAEAVGGAGAKLFPDQRLVLTLLVTLSAVAALQRA